MSLHVEGIVYTDERHKMTISLSDPAPVAYDDGIVIMTEAEWDGVLNAWRAAKALAYAIAALFIVLVTVLVAVTAT